VSATTTATRSAAASDHLLARASSGAIHSSEHHTERGAGRVEDQVPDAREASGNAHLLQLDSGRQQRREQQGTAPGRRSERHRHTERNEEQDVGERIGEAAFAAHDAVEERTLRRAARGEERRDQNSGDDDPRQDPDGTASRVTQKTISGLGGERSGHRPRAHKSTVASRPAGR
jgi:hypothetical protein